MDYPKGTELGASMFIPFQGARSVVKLDDKRQRKAGEMGENREGSGGAIVPQ